MRYLTIAAALAAAGMPAAAMAQTAPAAAAVQPDSIAEPFFKALQRGDTAGAMAVISKASPLLAKKMDNDDSMDRAMETALSNYGPVLAWERIDSKPLGTLMRRDTYLVQHRDMVTRWRFIYARSGNGWVLNFFGFEDQAQTWFD